MPQRFEGRVVRLEQARGQDVGRWLNRPAAEWPERALCRYVGIDPEAFRRDDPEVVAQVERIAAGGVDATANEA